MTTDPVGLAAAYLSCVRRSDDATHLCTQLGDLSRADLEAGLDAPGAPLAFWLNVYNATVQRDLQRDPSLFEDKRAFFGDARLTIAGEDLSLDDIEHGLLRRSQTKYGLGYVRNPFPADFEREFRVRDRDPRIHFALNCGAASCPPIVGYHPESLDGELDHQARAYLERTVSYEPDDGLLYDGVARVPRLFLWFRGDWGGKSGILEFLDRYDALPADVRPRLKHRKYDWSLKVGAFAEEIAAQ